jgi:thiamine pyrophosphokinase
MRAYDNEFEYFFIKKRIEIDCKRGEVISLLALPEATGVTTKGLKYALKNGTLKFGGMQGALNSAVENSVSIKLKKGYLLLLRRFEV